MSGCVKVCVCVCVFVGTVGYGVCDCCMCWFCVGLVLLSYWCVPLNVEPQLHVVVCVWMCLVRDCVLVSIVCGCVCVYECMCG